MHYIRFKYLNLMRTILVLLCILAVTVTQYLFTV
jgi:hypothetical protein